VSPARVVPTVDEREELAASLVLRAQAQGRQAGAGWGLISMSHRPPPAWWFVTLMGVVVATLTALSSGSILLGLGFGAVFGVAVRFAAAVGL
jgi:hypothetical protein